jgi:cytosine permease
MIVAALALGRIGSLEGGLGEILSAEPAQPIAFQVAMGAAISTWITGAALVADITRYASRGRDVVISGFVGFALGAGVFEAVATVSAMKVGDSNFVGVMSGLGLLAPAVLLLVLALWNTTDNNLYSSALAFTNASRVLGMSIPKPVWTIVSVLIALGVAFLGLAARFLTFLQVIGLVTPPFAGVLIAHFFVLGGVRRSTEELVRTTPTVRIEALVAWIGASLVTYYTDIFVDAITGLVLGGIFYSVLILVRRSLSSSADITPSGEVAGGGR